MRQRKHNRTAGFSLIEVVVGIALLGLVTAPICASLVLSVRLNAHSQALMQARLQASGVVETLLAEGVDVSAKVGEDNVWTWDSEKAHWTRDMDGVTVEVKKENSSDPFYTVTVTSSVSVGEKEETVKLTTHVRKGGG